MQRQLPVLIKWDDFSDWRVRGIFAASVQPGRLLHADRISVISCTEAHYGLLLHRQEVLRGETFDCHARGQTFSHLLPKCSDMHTWEMIHSFILLKCSRRHLWNMLINYNNKILSCATQVLMHKLLKFCHTLMKDSRTHHWNTPFFFCWKTFVHTND